MSGSLMVRLDVIWGGSQPRPYADHKYEGHITFSAPEGQLWGSKWMHTEDIKTFEETVHESGGTVIYNSNIQTREQMVNVVREQVKRYLRLMVTDFIDDPEWYQTRLEKLEYVGDGKWYYLIWSSYID